MQTRRGTRPVGAVRRALASRDGVAAVEFAFAISVFIVFLMGVVEVGRALWTEHALDYAAEQATRYVLGNPDASNVDIQNYAESQLMTVDIGAVTVTVVDEVLDGISYLTVKVAYPFQASVAFVPLGSINLTGVSRIARNT